jgi:hypothetical protein
MSVFEMKMIGSSSSLQLIEFSELHKPTSAEIVYTT